MKFYKCLKVVIFLTMLWVTIGLVIAIRFSDLKGVLVTLYVFFFAILVTAMLNKVYGDLAVKFDFNDKYFVRTANNKEYCFSSDEIVKLKVYSLDKHIIVKFIHNNSTKTIFFRDLGTFVKDAKEPYNMAKDLLKK